MAPLYAGECEYSSCHPHGRTVLDDVRVIGEHDGIARGAFQQGIKSQCEGLPEDGPALRIHHRTDEHNMGDELRAPDGQFCGELRPHRMPDHDDGTGAYRFERLWVSRAARAEGPGARKACY